MPHPRLSSPETKRKQMTDACSSRMRARHFRLSYCAVRSSRRSPMMSFPVVLTNMGGRPGSEDMPGTDEFLYILVLSSLYLLCTVVSRS